MLGRKKWLRWRKALIFFQTIFRRVRMNGFVEERVVAAVNMQRCAMGWLVRRGLQREYRAASMIRAVWVGGVVRAKHALRIRKAVRLQAWVRGMQARQKVMR